MSGPGLLWAIRLFVLEQPLLCRVRLSARPLFAWFAGGDEQIPSEREAVERHFEGVMRQQWQIVEPEDARISRAILSVGARIEQVEVRALEVVNREGVLNDRRQDT